MSYQGLKYIVVGAGFFGSVIAERIANVLNEKVLVLDKREHIGGNSYSEVDPQTGVEVHKYGSHIFHTKDQETWDYINKFCEFNNYRHRVLTYHEAEVYSMPINLMTINKFFGKQFKPAQAQEFIQNQIAAHKIERPNNLEEKAISLIGKPLFEAFIKGYTQKQWQTSMRELPANIITRLPVRFNYNDRYFNDPYEGIPIEGYTSIFKKMLSHENIEVKSGVDYFEFKSNLPDDCKVIYSGPIDRFFDYKYGELAWRTLDFEVERHDISDFQGTSVMNYASEDVPYTRTHEFKHFHPERTFLDKTTIFTEFSRTASRQDEPYYPINTERNSKLFQKYNQDAMNLQNVIFGGRLGAYKYLDMDQVIKAALLTFKKKVAIN